MIEQCNVWAGSDCCQRELHHEGDHATRWWLATMYWRGDEAWSHEVTR